MTDYQSFTSEPLSHSAPMFNKQMILEVPQSDPDPNKSALFKQAAVDLGFKTRTIEDLAQPRAYVEVGRAKSFVVQADHSDFERQLGYISSAGYGCDRLQVMIVLGDPVGLEQHLVRDVPLCILESLNMKPDASVVPLLPPVEAAFHKLVSQTHSVKGVIDDRVAVETVDVCLLRAPTIKAFRHELSLFFGRLHRTYTIYFCGHGAPDGTFSLTDNDITGGLLYAEVVRCLQVHDYPPVVTLKFNCCYAEELTRSAAAMADLRSENKTLFVDDMLCLRPIEEDNCGSLQAVNSIFQIILQVFFARDEAKPWWMKFQAAEQIREFHDQFTAEQKCISVTDDRATGCKPHVDKNASVDDRELEARTMLDNDACGDVMPGDIFEKPSAAVFDDDEATARVMETMERIGGYRLSDARLGDLTVFVQPLGFNLLSPEGTLLNTKFLKPHASLLRAFVDYLVTKAGGASEVLTAMYRIKPLTRPSTAERDKLLCSIKTSTRPLVHLFKVGQGDTTLITLPVGSKKVISLLVDGGRSWERAQGWFGNVVGALPTLHYVVVTHADADHISGIQHLARYATAQPTEEPRISRVLMSCPPDIGDRDGKCRAVKSISTAFETRVLRHAIRCSKPLDTLPGNVSIYVLNPDKTRHEEVTIELARSRPPTIYNKAALSLLIIWHNPEDHTDNLSLLITSDVPEDYVLEGLNVVWPDMPVEDQLAVPRWEHCGRFRYYVDYMDVPHHGSKHDSSEKLYRHVHARYIGWSSNGGRSFNTMDPTVLRHICEEMNTASPTVFFTFDKWAKEEWSKDADDLKQTYPAVELSYLERKYLLHEIAISRRPKED